MKNACYSINRKRGYVTIYNIDVRYPLSMWNEYKAVNGLSHQDVANQLMKLEGVNKNET